MKRCEHDPVFSGRTGATGKFECICRLCGALSWSESYVLAQVDVYEFCRQRALHGWAAPRIPVPPLTGAPARVPRYIGPLVFNSAVFLGALLFGTWCAHDPERRNLIVAALAGTFALCGALVSFAGWRKTR